MTRKNAVDVKKWNAEYQWQPFADPNAVANDKPLIIESGKGSIVYDIDGKEYIDGQGGLWNVNAGHGRKEIIDAITEQLNQLQFYSLFGGTTHSRSIELSKLLVDMTAEEGMKRVFFSTGGSEAVETALKLARQYWKLNGQAQRTKIISLQRAYHGVGYGGLSANGTPAFRRMFEPLMSGFFRVESPYFYRNPFTDDPSELARICAMMLERTIIDQSPDTVAAFIAEPIQGAGGIIVPPAEYWRLVREVCDKYGVLLIADEVVTGFGRTGSMFGSRLWGVKPDMMIFAKGINSGYVPLGATMFNDRIEQAFKDHPDAGFMHGNTYLAHPLACAAAIANLDMVVKEGLAQNAGEVGTYFMSRLAELGQRQKHVGEVRGRGLMIGVELVADKPTKTRFADSDYFGHCVARRCRDNGVLIRNVYDTFIISPPLILTKAQVDRMVEVMDEALTYQTGVFAGK
ncbi:aminotransferase class III-fold pyridoxal phosphate-dependent enzyme [Mesorhizobium sp. M8A.F.Ca.ET.173.01.1.1]|nr:aminotransferase class III-fold pyridoxal phosphate-dependent enzyme [Mesorhizobium sp. M8A.F.Ca.ET.173.01.1.1]